MKKVISFTLAVVLACSFLLGSAFASSGSAIGVVAPDTFISWGDFDNRETLSAPSVATSGRNFIVYKVRTLFYVQYVIDSFDPSVTPVEGGNYSFTRYWGSTALTNAGALQPSEYSWNVYSDVSYLFSADFTHEPVYANFDYYDADGELILNGALRGEGFNSLMDLTLNDGTVIQVPRSLQGDSFVIANSGSQYKIWNFGNPATLDGIYEGAEGVSYSTSDGTFVVGGKPQNILSFYDRFNDRTYTVDMSTFPVDVSAYPYVLVRFESGLPAMNFYCAASPNTVTEVITGRYSTKFWKNQAVFVQWQPSGRTWTTPALLSGNETVYIYEGEAENVVQYNYDLYSGSTFVYPASFSFSYSSTFWSWEDWQPSTDSLDITSFGSIVYQSFDYPLSAPGDEPDPLPDDSESGFFSWFKRQWVFFMEKLQTIIDLLKSHPDINLDGGSGSGQNLTFLQRVKQIFENALANVLESLLDLITRILDLVLGVVYDLLDFFFGLLTDTVVDGIGEFFEALTSGELLRFFRFEEPLLDEFGQPVLDENGQPVMNSVIALPSGVAAVFAFISSTIMLLPSELLFAILFGVGLSFLLAVLHLVKS